jgi:hypothetical protein
MFHVAKIKKFQNLYHKSSRQKMFREVSGAFRLRDKTVGNFLMQFSKQIL